MKKLIKRYSISIYTNVDIAEDFENLINRFLMETLNPNFKTKKAIFRVFLEEYLIYLKENNKYREFNENFNAIKLKGRRKTHNEKGKDKYMGIGNYPNDDDTIKVFTAVANNIAYNEEFKNKNNYSKSYVLEIVMEYIKNNFDKITNKYKVQYEY